jgi:hypothetical protein
LLGVLGFGLLVDDEEYVGLRAEDEEEEATAGVGRGGGGEVRTAGVGSGAGAGGGAMTGCGGGVAEADERTILLERDPSLFFGGSGSGVASSTGLSICGAGTLPPPRMPSAAHAAT